MHWPSAELRPEYAAGYDPAVLWSTPTSSPLVAQFLIAHRDLQDLAAAYRTDPEAIR